MHAKCASAHGAMLKYLYYMASFDVPFVPARPKTSKWIKTPFNIFHNLCIPVIYFDSQPSHRK